MYILYGGDFTRAPLVQWVLEEGRIEYELRKIDIIKGEHRTDEFLAMNPAGLIPVLITPDGDALYEVAALMVYLADRYQLSELAPAVTDRRRGLFLSTVFWIASDIQSEMKRFHFPHRYSLWVYMFIGHTSDRLQQSMLGQRRTDHARLRSLELEINFGINRSLALQQLLAEIILRRPPTLSDPPRRLLRRRWLLSRPCF